MFAHITTKKNWSKVVFQQQISSMALKQVYLALVIILHDIVVFTACSTSLKLPKKSVNSALSLKFKGLLCMNKCFASKCEANPIDVTM